MIHMFTKAKAAKLLRELVDRFLDMKQSTGKEVGWAFDDPLPIEGLSAGSGVSP